MFLHPLRRHQSEGRLLSQLRTARPQPTDSYDGWEEAIFCAAPSADGQRIILHI